MIDILSGKLPAELQPPVGDPAAISGQLSVLSFRFSVFSIITALLKAMLL